MYFVCCSSSKTRKCCTNSTCGFLVELLSSRGQGAAMLELDQSLGTSVLSEVTEKVNGQQTEEEGDGKSARCCFLLAFSLLLLLASESRFLRYAFPQCSKGKPYFAKHLQTKVSMTWGGENLKNEGWEPENMGKGPVRQCWQLLGRNCIDPYP